MSVDYLGLLPEPSVHTGAFSSPAIIITIVSSYFLLWIMRISYLSPRFIPGHQLLQRSLSSKSQATRECGFFGFPTRYLQSLQSSNHALNTLKPPLFEENVEVLPGTANTDNTPYASCASWATLFVSFWPLLSKIWA